MTLPCYWNYEYRALYDRTYKMLLIAGCEETKADMLAKERVIQKALSASNALQEFREMQARRKGMQSVLPPQ